jgi:hypothetical protein
MVFKIAEPPCKCPVAPIEYIFMADWFFHEKGVRQDVEIELVTPMAGAFSKPIASSILGEIAVEKNIKVTPNFDIGQVNVEEKTIESHKGEGGIHQAVQGSAESIAIAACNRTEKDRPAPCRQGRAKPRN